MAPIRTFIVDDHSVVISGLQSMLNDGKDAKVVGTAASGPEAIRELDKQTTLPDVVLMDIKMPEMNGIEATKEILARWPGLPVMALSMFDDEEYVVAMLQAGAKGYVLKNTEREELVHAISRVAKGETYFSQEATTAVMSSLMASRPGPAAEPAPSQGSARAPGPLPNAEGPLHPARGWDAAMIQEYLTRRELEILKLIASELTNQEIASRLQISPRTVHSHRRNLMQKVGVKNTAGLVRFALEHRIS